jgi:hypothetical protein
MAAIVVLDTSFLGTANPAARTVCMTMYTDTHFVTRRAPKWQGGDRLARTEQLLCALCRCVTVAPRLCLCTCFRICRAYCAWSQPARCYVFVSNQVSNTLLIAVSTGCIAVCALQLL